MKTRALGQTTTERSDGSARLLQRGSRLGRYELILPIGHGGMASVWAARLSGEAGFSKLVAIKTTLPHLADIAEIRRMLLDEARIAARLHHPNVVTIHELGDEQGIAYVVMEWLDCASLDQLLHPRSELSEGTPDPRIAARIVADACAGLHAAHELVDDAGCPLGVVHRDVSPHNLLISSDGAVKVADFGIVKARGQLHRTAAGGDPRGRLSYMSPEHVTRQAVDRRADVFALGCTLHEAITGEVAFAGQNEAQIILAIAEGRYEPRPAQLEKAPELFAIVARAIARAPEERYGTAEAMRFALEEWLERNAPPIATAADIAEFVRVRVGSELEARRTRLREALAAKAGSEKSQVARAEAAPLAATEGNGPDLAPPAVGEGVFSPAPVYHHFPRQAERQSPVWRATASVAVAAALVALGARAALNGSSRGRDPDGDSIRSVSETSRPAASAATPERPAPPARAIEHTAMATAEAADAGIGSPPARLDRPTPVPRVTTRRPALVSDDIPHNPY